MYQALYRKWRPKTFDDVVGQPHITETLKSQVRTGRTSHAYLFIGTRGTGKTTCAKILAKAVNCESPVDGNPCNRCRICRGIDDGSIMDVVEMDAASNNGVDNVRQLRDEAIFSPAAARKRVYIVDEVHMLSGSAFNALLKILEEPPEHLMFILATTELNKVPATILSRCQRHSFRRLDTESIVSRLNYVAAQEQISLTPEAAKLLAVRSEGGMRDALSMLDQCAGREQIDADTVYSALGLAGTREIAALLRLLAAHDSGGAIAAFNRLWTDGKDPATLLGELSTLLRDLLLDAVAPKSGRALRSGSYDDEILDGFRGVFTAERLIEQIGVIQDALGGLRAGQAKMRSELTLIALSEPELSDSIPALRSRIAALEQLVRSGVPARSVPAPAAEAPPAQAQTEPSQTYPTPTPAKQPVPIPEPLKREGPAAAPPPCGNEASGPRTEPEPAAEAAPRSQTEPGLPEKTAPQAQAEPEPADVPAAPDDGGLWARVCARLRERFPPGTVSVFTDEMMVNARFDGDTLKLVMLDDFARTMVDRPDILQTLGALASETAGRPIRVESRSPGAPELQRNAAEASEKLESLKQFEIVKFR